MDANRRIAVIAPEQLLETFAVLIQSAPDLHLIAKETNLKLLGATLRKQIPDAILVYLVPECETQEGAPAYEIIGQLKSGWPGARRITIVKYTSQVEKAIKSGADIALVAGVDAERLLAAIKKEPTG